jgi:hypothetical protein
MPLCPANRWPPSTGRRHLTPQTQYQCQRARSATGDPTIWGFILAEGWNVASRTATAVGGLGQIVGGGAACVSIVGCAAGIPLATLGASNLQEGLSGTPGFVRSAATSAFGNTAGNLVYDGTNIVLSGQALMAPTVRPGTFSLFQNISTDYVPAYQTMSTTGLATNIATSALSAADTVMTAYGICTAIGKPK